MLRDLSGLIVLPSSMGMVLSAFGEGAWGRASRWCGLGVRCCFGEGSGGVRGEVVVAFAWVVCWGV